MGHKVESLKNIKEHVMKKVFHHGNSGCGGSSITHRKI